MVVFTDWTVLGQGASVIGAHPDVSHGVAPPGFAALLSLELKHNSGLDVISSQIKTLSLWSADPRLGS